MKPITSTVSDVFSCRPLSSKVQYLFMEVIIIDKLKSEQATLNCA